MYEWKDAEKDRRDNLEERLAAYYGPKLREQPLSTASWQRLRSQLGPQRSPKRWRLRLRRPRRFWRRSVRFVPAFVQDTFARIMNEAHVSYPQSLLRCWFDKHLHVPAVHVSALGRHKIKLVLPSAAERSIGQSELDVVVATGLARYLYIREPTYGMVRMLVAIAMLLASVASILFVTQGLLVAVVPIAILLCTPWLLHIQSRKLAFRADTLMVLWLGRERICQGLHAMADRSRSPHRSKWGEPSLAERIDRVCGTHVAVEEERLTLVK